MSEDGRKLLVQWSMLGYTFRFYRNPPPHAWWPPLKVTTIQPDPKQKAP